jgi:3-hydroxyacyl-CoA dehydrogenase
LGKGVVHCNDTPGFLANRVGCYALQVAMVEAAALGLTVEEADAIMGRPMGIPKTGVFGLYDLIGLDLMQDVARSLGSALPESDPFQSVADGIPVTHRLVAEGLTGLKGGGGFYRETAEAGRQAVDLDSGDYRPAERPQLEAAAAGEREGLKALVDWPDKYGDFARRVLARVLAYAASLVPEVTDDPEAIDEAMKLGYNWAQGPFEMIDEIGIDEFCQILAEEDPPAPAFLEAAAGRGFYRAAGGRLEDLRHDGAYHPVRRAPGVVRLSDIMRTRAPLLDNGAARLWDVGEGVACLEFHTKANALVPDSMTLLHESLSLVERDFKALLIHNDAPHFSMGVNLEFVLEAAEAKDWPELERMLTEFQDTCTAVRAARFPVVAAPSGMTLGGGMEVVVHCDAMVCHANTTLGQVETLVGLIPGGGGAKELLNRWRDGPDVPPGVEAAVTAFRLVGTGQTASSPEEARPLRMMLERDRAVMNRDRLLAAARERALELAEGFAPRPAPEFAALGPAGYEAIEGVMDRLEEKGITTPHDHVVGAQLARILCGGDRRAGTPVSEAEIFAQDREAFLTLAGTEATRARIRHMLDFGRPLRN